MNIGNHLKMARIMAILAILSLAIPLCGCQAKGLQRHAEEANPASLTPEDAHPQAAHQQDNPFTFLFFSDTQADPQTGNYRAVGELLAKAVAQEQALRLVIFGGDTVNDGGDAAEWQSFWQEAQAPLDGLVTAAVAGNHDHYALLAQQFDYPQYAPAHQNAGFFYALDMGQIHFIMLDSYIMGAANQTDIEWLQDDLQSAAAQQANWRVAVMHHPMWPMVEDSKDMRRAATMREHFLPLLEAYGVDLILCGHRHMYARTLPMRGEAAADGGAGIIQIMAASGGKGSYALEDMDYLEASAEAPNYLLLTADSGTLTVTAYDGDENLLDACILTREQ